MRFSVAIATIIGVVPVLSGRAMHAGSRAYAARRNFIVSSSLRVLSRMAWCSGYLSGSVSGVMKRTGIAAASDVVGEADNLSEIMAAAFVM